MRRGRLAVMAWRQVRISAVVVALVLVGGVRATVATYGASGGARGMVAVLPLLHNPAVEALDGRVTTLATGGAYVQWKMGAWMALALAAWGALLATRVTRGAEDVGTWDLIAVAPPGRRRAFDVSVVALALAAVLAGVATALGLALGSQSVADSVLYGAGIAGVVALGAGTGLVAAQLSAPRRSASQVAMVALTAAFLARVVADGSHGAGWLRSLTPFGWLESLGAFQHREPGWLALLLGVPVVLAGTARILQSRRDVGIAPFARADTSRAHLVTLRSVAGFAVRQRRPVTLTWAGGLAVLALVMGYLTHSLVAFAHTDPAYVALLSRWGIGAMVSVPGFVGELAVNVSLALALFALAMTAVVGSDRLAGRLDVALSAVSRTRWILAAFASTLAAAVVLGAVTGIFVWVGVRLGGAPLSVGHVAAAVGNALVVVPLAAGFGSLASVVAARLAVVVGATLLALSYLVAVFAAPLHWPGWVSAASPWRYLRVVPPASAGPTSTIVLLAVGLALEAAAVVLFVRRDVVA